MKFLESFKLRWVIWVWNHTPTCAEMARLSSRGLDRPLTFKQHLQMRLHFLICAWCQRYQRHLRFLHRIAPLSPEQLELVSVRSLSAEARERIKRRLREVRD